MQQFFALFGTPQIKWILVLIIIDVILGIIAALVKKDFRLGKLAGFMKKGVLVYIFGFAVLEIDLEVEGLPARILQHEIDHLNGILFFDRISFWQRLKLLKRLKLGAIN